MFHFGDFSSEALQHRLHHRIAFKLSAQLLCGRPGARSRSGRCCNCFEFSTDSHRATEDLARSDTELLERFAAFEHFREGALVWGKINSQFGTFELPTRAVFDKLAQKFLLRLNRLLDFRNLLLSYAADLRGKWRRGCLWLFALWWLLRSSDCSRCGGLAFFRASWHSANGFPCRTFWSGDKRSRWCRCLAARQR